MNGHRRSELRSIALHRAVAEHLLADPEPVLSSAREQIGAWSKQGLMHPEHAERWFTLLELPVAEIVEALVRDDEEMRELRQASPFVGVLSREERERVLASS